MRPPQRDIRRIHKQIERIVANEPRPVALTDGEIADAVNKRMQLAPPLTANRVWYYRQELRISSNGHRREEYQNEQH